MTTGGRIVGDVSGLPRVVSVTAGGAGTMTMPAEVGGAGSSVVVLATISSASTVGGVVAPVAGAPERSALASAVRQDARQQQQPDAERDGDGADASAPGSCGV